MLSFYHKSGYECLFCAAQRMFLCSPIGPVANPYRGKLPLDSDDPDLIYAAARNIDITPGCCRHIADHAAA